MISQAATETFSPATLAPKASAASVANVAAEISGTESNAEVLLTLEDFERHTMNQLLALSVSAA